MKWRFAWLLTAAILFLGVGGAGVSSDVARRLITSSGTVLTLGAVSDGQVLARSGSTVVGATAYTSGGTDVAVADGGTGASTAATARVNLGVPRITSSTSAPTVNDDTDQGYRAGDLWVDTDSDATYQADSVADGAADWRAL